MSPTKQNHLLNLISQAYTVTNKLNEVVKLLKLDWRGLVQKVFDGYVYLHIQSLWILIHNVLIAFQQMEMEECRKGVKSELLSNIAREKMKKESWGLSEDASESFHDCSEIFCSRYCDCVRVHANFEMGFDWKK